MVATAGGNYLCFASEYLDCDKSQIMFESDQDEGFSTEEAGIMTCVEMKKLPQSASSCVA